jgi:hypothetical protein
MVNPIDVQDVGPQDAVAGEAGYIQPDPQEQPGDGIDTLPGPEQGEQKAERTFTESQVVSMRAETDRQNNALKSALGQYALNEQIAASQMREAQIAASEQALVDGGDITQEQAVQRAQDRTAQAQAHAALQQEQARVQNMGLQLGREAAAQEIGKKYGVDVNTLRNDPSLTIPELMEAKARQLQLDAREAKMTGTETFDSGQKSGGGSLNVNDMSGSALIRWGLAHPPKGQPKF